MPIVLPTPAYVAAAAARLAAGDLVAFPTETVYGLGADATNGRAVASLFAAKGRPAFNPLIVHVADAAMAWTLGETSPLAEQLAAAFWPGPLTIVVPLRADAGLAMLALAGLSTIALRVPSHPVALSLLRAVRRPIAAPSANRSGRISPTTAQHVASDLDALVALILDGGPAPVGLESTIVAVTGSDAILLRPGGITRRQIEAVTGVSLARMASTGGHAPTAPGQLASHYAPRATVRLMATEVASGEALLAFGAPLPHAGPMRNLSPAGDLVEAAAALFSSLRALDDSGSGTIAVMAIPRHGLGEAINDRLQRAAAPRDT